MINNLSRPKTASRRIVLIVAAVLVTAAAFGLAARARFAAPELPPLTWEELTSFEFNPYLIGYLFQGIVVPAVLIYLLSTTRLFRRAVGGQAGRRDGLRLFLALALIQLLVLIFDLWRAFYGGEPGPVVLGLLVIVTGGLLGGWRVGLSLGIITMLFRGSQELYMMYDGFLKYEIAEVYSHGGLGALVTWEGWWHIAPGAYVYNLWAASAVWAGCLAGLVGELLGERRFSPLGALLIGIGIDFGAGMLTTVAGTPPGVMFLVPSLLISGLAMVAVALMVRNVQADIARTKAESAELALARAELRALRAQINPHFLFNALNTIRYFVRTDPDSARRLLLNLSEVFQRALRSGELVPLKDEMSYVEAYLSLEQARLGDRLKVEWSIDGQKKGIDRSPLAEIPVPTLVLQPIVENAVVHGVSKMPEGGTVRVSASRKDNHLLLQVGDNGPGIAPERLDEILGPERAETKSIGLRNVDGRLRALYGDDHSLGVASQMGQGTSVRIRIPLSD